MCSTHDPVDNATQPPVAKSQHVQCSARKLQTLYSPFWCPFVQCPHVVLCWAALEYILKIGTEEVLCWKVASFPAMSCLWQCRTKLCATDQARVSRPVPCCANQMKLQCTCAGRALPVPPRPSEPCSLLRSCLPKSAPPEPQGVLFAASISQGKCCACV